MLQHSNLQKLQLFNEVSNPYLMTLSRPHTMLFDEYYQEKFYRIESAMSALEKTDTLLIVGTAFYTALSRGIVYESIKKRINIIEINKELQLNKAKWILPSILQIEGNSETILPALIND